MRYWENTGYYDTSGPSFDFGWFTFGFLIPLVLLDLILRGFALWKSARNGQNVWFTALLVINSMGILPLIYLLLNKSQTKVSKKK